MENKQKKYTYIESSAVDSSRGKEGIFLKALFFYLSHRPHEVDEVYEARSRVVRVNFDHQLLHHLRFEIVQGEGLNERAQT